MNPAPSSPSLLVHYVSRRQACLLFSFLLFHFFASCLVEAERVAAIVRGRIFEEAVSRVMFSGLESLHFYADFIIQTYFLLKR